ncbi:MAG: hypothetical protein IJU13_04605 [Bacteroidales bacterium]|nr:hypothetical protein [Bacteroidales bacterium]
MALVACVLTASAVSCSQKSELDPMPDSIRNPLSGDGDVWYPCTVSFSQEEGKSVLSNRHLTWESDDQVSVFVRNGSTNVCTNLKGDVYTDVSPRQFKFFSPVALSAGYKVYAYSPFSGEAGSNPTAVSLTLPAEQTQMIGTITAGGSGASGWRKAADEHFDGSSLPMVSIPVTLSAGSAVDTWTADATHFCNIASLACFRVYSSDASYCGSILGGNEFHFVTQIKFALTSGTGVSGTGTVDLTALTESSGDSAFALKGAAGTSVSVKTGVPVASSKDDATPIYMALLPGTWTGTLTITTVIGDFVFNLSGKQFKRSEMKTINVDLNNATVKPEPGLKGTKVDSYTAIRGKQASVGSKVLKDSDFGSGSHYYFYGIVVGDCDNANMDQNLQHGTTVDGLDVKTQSPVYTTSDWGFGLVPYRFRLPAAVLGKSKVRVRIVPSSLRMAEWNSGGDPNWARGQTYRARSIVQNFTYTGAGGITLQDVQIQYK